jgi:hypothetical protein
VGKRWLDDIAAVAGTAAGSLAGIIVGYSVGSAFSDRYLADKEMEQLGPVIIGAALMFIGAGALGCYVALRLARSPKAGMAAGFTAVLLPILGALWIWLTDRFAGIDGAGGAVVNVVLYLVPIAAAAVGGRRLAVMRLDRSPEGTDPAP